MPAVSKKQQRFFGMVRAAQKGEMDNPSKEVLDVANDISMKDAKKFAKTKHKGLPEKKKVDECWKTHKKVGMKMKGGKLVPDCRPKNKKVNEDITGGISSQDYTPDMKFREYEFIDIIKAESLKGAVSESSDYEKLKKKVGSKVKHDKPAMTFKEFKNINKYT